MAACIVKKAGHLIGGEGKMKLNRYETAVLDRVIKKRAHKEGSETVETRFITNLYNGVRPWWWEENEERP
jgi:hypothetical protein